MTPEQHFDITFDFSYNFLKLPTTSEGRGATQAIINTIHIFDDLKK